jgi:hypothetical protein
VPCVRGARRAEEVPLWRLSGAEQAERTPTSPSLSTPNLALALILTDTLTATPALAPTSPHPRPRPRLARLSHPHPNPDPDPKQERYLREVACEHGGIVANERYLPRGEWHLPGVTYVVVLRHPISRLISNWLHDSANEADLPPATNFSEYTRLFARRDFMTRALCGADCIASPVLSEAHYARAASNLARFSVVLVLELLKEGLARLGAEYNWRAATREAARPTHAPSGATARWHAALRASAPMLHAELRSINAFDLRLHHGALERECHALGAGAGGAGTSSAAMTMTAEGATVCSRVVFRAG